jgi:hypothetical protein
MSIILDMDDMIPQTHLLKEINQIDERATGLLVKVKSVTNMCGNVT